MELYTTRELSVSSDTYAKKSLRHSASVCVLALVFGIEDGQNVQKLSMVVRNTTKLEETRARTKNAAELEDAENGSEAEHRNCRGHGEGEVGSLINTTIWGRGIVAGSAAPDLESGACAVRYPPSRWTWFHRNSCLGLE